MIRVRGRFARQDPLLRIEGRLDKRGECWIWQGKINNGGYGCTYADGHHIYVHRFMYEARIGPIPDGCVIDHLCRNRACAKPEHLEAVTQSVNVRRALDRHRNSRKTHCSQGHDYAKTATLRRDGSRECRTCKHDWDRAYRLRKKTEAA